MLCVRLVQNSLMFAEKFNIFQNFSFFFVAEPINIIFDGTAASSPVEIELYFILQLFIVIIYHIRYGSIAVVCTQIMPQKLEKNKGKEKARLRSGQSNRNHLFYTRNVF